MSIRQDSWHNYYACGSDSLGYIQKMDVKGNLVWKHKYNADQYFEHVVDLNDNVVSVGNKAGQFIVNSLGTGSGTAFNKVYTTAAAGNTAKTIDYTVNAAGQVNGYLVGGQMNSYPYLIKIKTDGTVVWEKQINYPTSGRLLGSVLCVRHTYDGGYIVLSSLSTSLSHTVVTKFDSSNNITWAYDYNNTYPTGPNNTVAKIIQTDDDGNGIKNDGYVISMPLNAGFFKIHSNGSVDWSNAGYVIQHTSVGAPVADYNVHSIIQDNSGYLVAVGSTSSSGTNSGFMIKMKYVTSGSVGTPNITATGTFCKQYTAWVRNDLSDVIQTSDNGYMIIGDGGGSNAEYFVKSDKDGISGTSCNELTVTSSTSLSTIAITSSNVTSSISASTVTSFSNNITLTTLAQSPTLTATCPVLCTSPSAATISSQRCDTIPDTLTLNCSSPGVEIRWYKYNSVTHKTTALQDSGKYKIAATDYDTFFFAKVSYGSCTVTSDSFQLFDVFLNPDSTISINDFSNVYLSNCPSHSCTDCTAPLVGVQKTNYSALPSGFRYKWYKVVGVTKTLITPVGDGSQCSIDTAGNYEVDITHANGLCASAPLTFSAFFVKPTITGASICDMSHIVDRFGSKTATLRARCIDTSNTGNRYHYHWYWHSLNPARSHSFTRLTDSSNLITVYPGVYYVEYTDNANKCYSYRSDVLTYSSPDTSIHPAFEFNWIRCVGGQSTIECTNETIESMWNPYGVRAKQYQWKVNGVVKQTDASAVDFDYGPIHHGDTISLEVTDSGYCVHSVSHIVTGTVYSSAPTISVYDGYYDSSAHAWVNTSAYGSLPCTRKYHQVRVTGTNLDDMFELGYKPILGAVLNRVIVSDTPSHFDRIYNIDSSYTGSLTFYATNSSCLSDSVTISINYAKVEPYKRWSRFNVPTNTFYIVEGTPALDFVQTDFYEATLPTVGTLSRATSTYIDAAGHVHSPSASSSDKFYSLNPSGTFPDNMFNAASDSVTSDTASNKTYKFDVTFHASSASNPKTACDNAPTREIIHVFRPIIKSSNLRFCGGTTSVTVTDSIFNFPVDTITAAGFNIAITYYDAANNKLNSTPIVYQNNYVGPIVSSYTIPTTYGNSYYIEMVITSRFYSSFPTCTIKKLITLSGAYLAHTIDFQQKINGTYISVSNGDTVCLSGGQFPDIKTLITPGSESLSGGTYTYQWYDASGTAITGDSGRVHNHLCDTFSLPIFHAANAAVSYSYPFHVIVTELSGSGTLCSGATGTGHGCAVSKTLIYVDNTPQGVSISQSATFFCSSSMQLYATYDSHYTYQWQELVNGTWTDSFNSGGGANSDTLIINHIGTYRCEVSKTRPSYATCPVFSNSITITAPVLTIYDVTGSYSITTSILQVSTSTATYFGAPYHWYYVSSTGTSPSTLGPTTGTLSFVGGSYSAGYYYLKALSTCGDTVYSNLVYVTGTCPTSGIPIPTTTTTTVGTYYQGSSYTTPTLSSISIGTTSATSTIVMGGNTSLTVPNGANLTLINCDISCCTGMWKGIVVNGGGSLTLTNCTIHNATIAVYSEDGGAISISGSTFKNNVNHIAMVNAGLSSLAANITSNTFGNLLVMPGLSSTSFYAPLSNSNYGKMIYLNGVQHGFTSGSIATNTFDNYLPAVNGSYASGIEVYNSDSFSISGNTFGTLGPNFDRGVYMESGNGLTSRVNFSGNTFQGSSSAKTFRTGIYYNNVEGCLFTGSSASLNKFYYLVNGIEYYQNHTISNLNSITFGDFEHDTYGIVAASGSHPVTVGSGNGLTNTLNLIIECNKFIYDDFGIIGNGNLLTQGSSIGTDAGNNFNKATPGTICPCSTQNSKADILWVTPASSPTFYYNPSHYNGTITTSTSPAIVFNGSTVSSSSTGLIGSSSNPATCYGTFKKDEVFKTVNADSFTALKVYPNPSSGYFTVELPESGETAHYMMQVTDITGRRIYRCTVGNKSLETIDASTWASGAYFITLVSEAGRPYNVKIVKQK